MSFQFWSMIVWLIAACFVGFAVSAIFSSWMKLSRRLFLIPYVALVGIFLSAFTILNGMDIPALFSTNWVWGLLAGGLASVFLVLTVSRQPASRQSSGPAFVLDLTWSGLVYGLVDALFLNVLPVAAIGMGMSQFGWAATLSGKIAVAAFGLFASLLVTFTYHWGYTEFRNKKVSLVLAGNSIITLAFIISGSLLGSILSHTAMHVAAVFQGPETTIQLPPHYQSSLKSV